MIMKKLILGLSILAMMGVQLFSQAIVIYNSDNPYSSAAAAVVDQKHGINYYLDCAGADSAAQAAFYGTLPEDTTLLYAYVVSDTSLWYEAGKFMSLYRDSIDTHVLGDSAITYYIGDMNATKCEMTWDSLYTGIVPPLIISYLSEGGAWYDRADASGGTDSTIFKTNPTGWTDSTWTGDYVWISTGPGIGEAKQIELVIAAVAGDADTIEVVGTFSAAITSSSDFTVSPASNYTRVGFYDMYAYYGVLMLLDDFNLYAGPWQSLLDYGGNLNSLSLNSGLSPRQNRTYLSTVTTTGQGVFDYLVKIN